MDLLLHIEQNCTPISRIALERRCKSVGATQCSFLDVRDIWRSRLRLPHAEYMCYNPRRCSPHQSFIKRQDSYPPRKLAVALAATFAPSPYTENLALCPHPSHHPQNQTPTRRHANSRPCLTRHPDPGCAGRENLPRLPRPAPSHQNLRAGITRLAGRPRRTNRRNAVCRQTPTVQLV